MMHNYRKWFFLALAFLAGGHHVAQAQERTLHGQVTAGPGHTPLPGVSVILQGSTTGTATDADGYYSITAGNEDVLVFSLLGFVSREVPVSSVSGETLDITLEEDVAALDEVVVVGYGTQKRSDLTGSVATIRTERLESKPNVNIAQALQGSMPGLSVTTTSSNAEESSTSLLLRGRNSLLASNSPLIVLDGIPFTGSINEINPNDVATISVLKDASAAAIYGSRGSNGVILVTTKKGKAGKPTISYDGYYGITKMSNLPEVYDGPGFAEMKMNRKGEDPDIMTESELAILESGKWVDWIDLATQNGYKQDHNVSFTGGTENTTYYIAANLFNAEGIAINDKFSRYSLRANVEQKITDWLTFGTNSRLSQSDRGGEGAIIGGERGAYFLNPLTSPYNEDGSLTIYPWPEEVFWYNPLYPLLAESDDVTRYVFTNNYLNVEIPFIEGLSYRLNTGVEYRGRNRSTYYGRNTQRGLENQGDADIVSWTDNNYLVENIVNYDRTWNKHHLSVTGLYSYQQEKNLNNSISAQGFPNDVLTYYQANLGKSVSVTSSYVKEVLLSQMGRFNYDFDDRYLLTFTVRRDGFSGFGNDTKFGVFPSLALGWNLHNEAFIRLPQNLDQLKLRLSYGLNGNQAVGPYDNLARLTDLSYVIGSETAPGFIPSRLANQNLSWESTATLNLGVDFGLWENRIFGSVDVYDARTSDLLVNREIPNVHGISTITQNIGETRNRGVEVMLGGYIIDGRDFKWLANANFSANRNEIVSLYGKKQDDVANDLFIGEPVRVIYELQFDGIWQTGEDPSGSAQPEALPGHVKIKDVANEMDENGNPIPAITTDLDRQILGQEDPKAIWGFQNTFTYKNFSLYAFFHGVHGVTKQNTTKNINVFGGVQRNTYVHDFWTPENPTNEYFANDVDANIRNVRFYENADFIRLKDITLSYTFPQEMLSRAGLGRAKIYVNARNLLTITNWTGLDPELSAQDAIPLQKEFMFGLNFSF